MIEERNISESAITPKTPTEIPKTRTNLAVDAKAAITNPKTINKKPRNHQPVRMQLTKQQLANRQSANHQPVIQKEVNRKPVSKGNQQASSQLNFTILNSDRCIKYQPQVLVWVYSAPGNFRKRKADRETWANSTLYLPMNVTFVFSLAVTHDKDMQQQILQEYTIYGDLVQDESFVDSYKTLARKVNCTKYSIIEYKSMKDKLPF